MGKNPNTIFRELYRKAKNREAKAISVGSTNSVLEMGKQDGCVYVTEKEVIQNFMIEGYSELRANKHILQWIDYDLLFIRYNNGFKYIGFSKELK